MKWLKIGKMIEIGVWGIVIAMITTLMIRWVNGEGIGLKDKTNSNEVASKITEAKREQFEMDTIHSVEMELGAADVEVELVEGDHTMEIIESTNDTEASHLFEVRQEGDKLLVERHGEEEQAIQISLDSEFFFWSNQPKHVVRIKLPASYQESLSIGCSSGEIEIKNAIKLKNLELTTASGDMDMKTVEAETVLKTASGKVQAEKMIGDRYSIETASGDIEIKEGQGQFKIGSASGEISLGKVEGAGKIESASGDINMEEVLLNGDLKINTISGRVETTIDSQNGATVKMQTVSGNIEGNAEINNKGGKSATAKIGVKQPYQVFIQTTSGDITIDEQ